MIIFYSIQIQFDERRISLDRENASTRLAFDDTDMKFL